MNWIVNLVDFGVVGVLLLLSVLVVALSIERRIFFKHVDVATYSSRNQLELQLAKNMQIIGTVAGNAPYIGLLGTVLGIMLTFHHISQSSNMETLAVMAGLSLALKATAIGLVVAIVSVVLYNLLARQAKDILLQWEIHHER